MFPVFNTQSLKTVLASFNRRQQLAFGAMCCERLLPNYQAFQNDTGWGDITPIREALNFVWESVVTEAVNRDQVKTLTLRCEAVAPDSEYFESLFVSCAQDACFAVCNLLDFLLENEVDRVIQAAIYAIDSIDLYVQEIEEMDPGNPSLEADILSHSLMQRELEQQTLNLKAIEKNPEVNSTFVSNLRLSWGNNGKSNLNLPI